MTVWKLSFRLTGPSSEETRAYKKPFDLRFLRYLLFKSFWAVSLACLTLQVQSAESNFKVIAFHTGKSDQAHISFVKEANQWFPGWAGNPTGTIQPWADLNGRF